ncbi:hypothetical protein VYU27_003647 [Nannochloropsis oceanica]
MVTPPGHQSQSPQQPTLEGKNEMDRIQAFCQTKCKKFACAIQQCMERHQYQEKPCWKEIADWDICCDRIKARIGETSTIPSASPSSSFSSSFSSSSFSSSFSSSSPP